MSKYHTDVGRQTDRYLIVATITILMEERNQLWKQDQDERLPALTGGGGEGKEGGAVGVGE